MFQTEQIFPSILSYIFSFPSHFHSYHSHVTLGVSMTVLSTPQVCSDNIAHIATTSPEPLLADCPSRLSFWVVKMYCFPSNVTSVDAGSKVSPSETSFVPSGLALYGSPRLMSSGVKVVERKESVWPSEATACSWEIRIAWLGTV